MTDNAVLAHNLAFNLINKTDDEYEQMKIALSYFKTYGAEMKKRLEGERDGKRNDSSTGTTQ